MPKPARARDLLPAKLLFRQKVISQSVVLVFFGGAVSLNPDATNTKTHHCQMVPLHTRPPWTTETIALLITTVAAMVPDYLRLLLRLPTAPFVEHVQA